MNNVVLNKKVSIERCIVQIRHYYAQESLVEFKKDFMKQDAISINLQRACELAIDMANYTIKSKKLGLPQSSKDSFSILFKSNILEEEISIKMQKMVGFRNVLVHEYQELDLELMVIVIENHLDDILKFANSIIKVFINE